MRWEERLDAGLGDVFEDLEQQAEGLALAERDAEVVEQSRAEYARVDLAGRLHASVGTRLLVTVAGVGPLDARLVRVGDGWCLLDAGVQEWVVALPAVVGVRGLSERAVEPGARALTARLGLASALRELAAGGDEAVLLGRDGSVVRGTLHRVGADFVDVWVGEARLGHRQTVPFGAVAAVRTG